MGANGSGKQRKLGAIEPEIVTSRAIANRVVDRMVPTGPADFDGWTAADIVRWIEQMAVPFEPVRLTVGLGLWVLRDRMSEKAYGEELRRLAEHYDVDPGTLWRWRTKAQELHGLGVPSGAARRSLGQTTSPKVRARHARTLDQGLDQDRGTVPDQGPGGVTPGGADGLTPQEPPPNPPATDLAAEPPNAGDGRQDTSPGQREEPAGSGVRPVTISRALDLIAVSSTEELRAAGHVRVRDAVNRLAQADGRVLVLRADLDAMRAAAAGAPTPRAGLKTPAPAAATSANGCPHPSGSRQSLPSGIVKCGKCGANKVGSTWRPAA